MALLPEPIHAAQQQPTEEAPRTHVWSWQQPASTPAPAAINPNDPWNVSAAQSPPVQLRVPTWDEFPHYDAKPDRWDVHNVEANRNPGETLDHYMQRAHSAAVYWATQDAPAKEEAARKQERAEARRERNRQAQAAFRERQRAAKPAPAGRDPVVMQAEQHLRDAINQRAVALAQWNVYVASARTALASAKAYADAGRAQQRQQAADNSGQD